MNKFYLVRKGISYREMSYVIVGKTNKKDRFGITVAETPEYTLAKKIAGLLNREREEVK